MKPPPILIAYGSLMSGLGLASLAPLPATDAYRVRLSGCRRGFGKFSQYGDRFAMVLEPLGAGEPIRAERLAVSAPPAAAGEIDALALALPVPELARVAQREGYRAAAFLALAREAETAGHGLGAHLAALLAAADHDVARYRERLAAAVGYTSAHYLPHPVAMAGGDHALTFVPPGLEGSGRADVVPIRVQSAETRLLTVRQVWRIKPNQSQLDYLAMCLLAEVHGISLADVVADLLEYPPLAQRIEARLAPEREAEPARFREVLGLTTEAYAQRFAPR